MLAAILLFSTWTVLGIPGAVIGIPWTLATRNVALLHWLGVSITRAGLWVAGIRMQVVWEQPPVRGQQYIFLPNHISNLDPPILYPLLPGHTAVFLKRSLMRIPVLGYAMGLAKFIPVDRDRRVESAMESVAAARSVLAAGIHVLSFVEGTRSRDGRLQAFNEGAVLFVDGERRAGGSNFDLRDRDDDEEGKPEDLSGDGARDIPCAAVPWGLCLTGGAYARGARGNCCRFAGVDAGAGGYGLTMAL